MTGRAARGAARRLISAGAQVAVCALAVVCGLSGASASQQELLVSAEAMLAQGDGAAAVATFERAAALAHAGDIELGLVRAYMQRGEYRRALAFAAHVAGAHADVPPASALYGWLLAAGGQGAYAQAILTQASTRTVGNAVLDETRQHLATPGATTTAALRTPPHRLAPYAVMQPGQAGLPAAIRVVSTGVLLPHGQRALLPAGGWLDGDAPLWVRDGLGRTTAVRILRRMDPLRLVLVELEIALDSAATPVAPRDPFAGSVGHVAGYAPSGDGVPAWPWLYSGFVGAAGAGADSARRLGIDVPAAVQGAPVFDAAGRWAGIVSTNADGGHVLLTVQRLRAEGAVLSGGMEQDQTPDAVVAPAPVRMPADEVYERALRVALQVIAPAPPPPRPLD